VPSLSLRSHEKEPTLPRLVPFAAAAFLLASSVSAAPLCHDLKGLFTPCPRDKSGQILKTPVDHAAAAVHNEEQEAQHKEAHARHLREHPDEPEKPPLVSTGKLCHDSKGLFKPC
jgi:hypothetical protein